MKPLPETIPASEILAEIRAAGKPELGPGAIRGGSWKARLDALSDAELLGVAEVTDPDAAACVRSGLLLFAGDLDASHGVSQSIPTPDGSYWHGILHRREPDYSNSKYWFRRVGNHPVFQELAGSVAGAGSAAAEVCRDGSWDPFAMVDLVEACERGRRPECRPELLELQEREMLLLLSHCYQSAVGQA